MILSGTEQKNEQDSPAFLDVEARLNLVVGNEASTPAAESASESTAEEIRESGDNSVAPELTSDPGSRTFRPHLIVVFLLFSLIVSALMQSGDWEHYKYMPDKAIADVWQAADFGSQEHRQRTLRALSLAARRGSCRAWTGIGYLYATGLPQDLPRSKQAYERAIRAGDPVAMHNLALDYETGVYGPVCGIGSSRESAPYFEKALKLYERAAKEKNHPPSMLALSYFYRRDVPGVPADKKKAFYWAKRSAESGYVNAYPVLASYYESGIGVEKDVKKAVRWLERASETGADQSTVHLGTIYFYGYNVPVDYRKAFDYFSLSSDPASRNFLGRMYENGLGAAKNNARAREMYESAVANGSAEGHLRLGLLNLKEGKGTRGALNDEMVVGFVSLKEEAESIGEGWTCYLLAHCYEHGYGVEKNMAEAVRWYQKGALKNQLEAIVELKKLGKPVPESESVTGGRFETTGYLMPFE